MPRLRHLHHTLSDLDAFDVFIAENREAIREQYPNHSEEDVLRACCDGGLMIGGGAAPLVMVRFDGEG